MENDEKKSTEKITAVEVKSGYSSTEESSQSYGDESDDSDFDREYTCDHCDMTFSGINSIRQHDRTGEHRRTARLQREMEGEERKNQNKDGDTVEKNLTVTNKAVTECEICDETCTGSRANRRHCRSKDHKRNIEELRFLGKANEDGNVNMEKFKEFLKSGKLSKKRVSIGLMDAPEDLYKCECCQKDIDGFRSFQYHLGSKSHQNSAKERDLQEKLKANSDDEKPVGFYDETLFCETCRLSFSGTENVQGHLESKNHANMLNFVKWENEKESLKENLEKCVISSE